MGKKYLLSFILVVFYSVVTAQKNNLSPIQKNISAWEKLIHQQEILGKDTSALKEYLQPLKTENSGTDQVIYDLLLAKAYANFFDQINPKSDEYFSRSLLNSKKLDHKALEIWVTLCYAEYFYNYRHMTKALPFFVSAIEKIEQTDPSEIIFPAVSYTKIGFYMGTIGDYKEAINYLKKALHYTEENSVEFANIGDNLGIYYTKIGDIKNAKYFIDKASKIARSNGYQVRYAKTLGNLAILEELNRNFPEAIRLLLEDIKISEENKSNQNTMYAYTILARLYIANEESDKAKEAITKADAIAKSKSYFKINELEILKLKLEIIYRDGKEGAEELDIRRRIDILEDSLSKTDGVLPINQANWMMQKRTYQQNIAATKEKLSRESFFKNIAFIIFGVLLILALLAFYNSRKKEKAKELQNAIKFKEYEEAKLRNEQKLLDAKKNFDSQFDFLKEKNIQIQSLYLEIENIKSSKSKSKEQDRGKLDDLLQSHLMTEENWLNFRREFQNEYSDFYEDLQEGFPEITDSNLRIIFLQKLGFSNTEISGLLGITVDAVKKSKQRLKRKLGEKHDQLFNMIFSEN